MGSGGGGPKAELLQKMIAEEGLESRVHMAGPIPHEKARDLLVSDWHDSHRKLGVPAVLTKHSECILVIGCQHEKIARSDTLRRMVRW